MITLYLHDNDTTATQHGVKGPTHAGTVRVDYDYQVDMWLDDIAVDYPFIIKIEASDGRVWLRQGKSFIIK